MQAGLSLMRTVLGGKAAPRGDIQHHAADGLGQALLLHLRSKVALQV
jgi:hypothetical protein